MFVRDALVKMRKDVVVISFKVLPQRSLIKAYGTSGYSVMWPRVISE
jgi:hypothetical protein